MLTVHRAERADRLVAVLAEHVGGDDPFAPDVVAVPTRGIERWVTQRLSLGSGVCANVHFPSPRQVVVEAVAAASGIDPREDPWRPERAAWTLGDLVDAHVDEPWLAVLRRHLEASPEPHARRLGVARRLAVLFDRYARHRPGMVRAWGDGRPVDEEGDELPSDLAWQARLWSLLRERLSDTRHPAERVDDACVRLREEPGLVDLPARLSLFGVTRLPAADLDVVRALAERREVHLLILHPSPALWDRLAAQPSAVRRRAGHPTLLVPRHPLLASWAHDVRELQLLLGADCPSRHHPVELPRRTLLERLQCQVQSDAPPDRPEPVEPGDASVQVHACHGRARQVEVLHDCVLGLLADDPTLELRHILVMCPDIEDFAPLISATFGAGHVSEDGDGRRADGRPPNLRVRLADRALRQTNPVLAAVAAVLELAGGRMAASHVLDLADRDPVRRRFGFDDDDLARVERWVGETGVRWGLDAPDRAPFRLEEVPEGTWRAGLDRILLGTALAEDDHRVWGETLPLDDVDSGAIDLAGRFAELLDRLDATAAALRAAQPMDGWARAIADAADALTATAPRDAWQRTELHRILDDLVQEAEGTTTAVTLAEVRELLADRLAGRPTRANFRTGAMTVCTLLPMRSVPHRVVCLLGLDDGSFPRGAPRDGDDLLLREPQIGERDPRTEDRQLLLDALMATTQTLVVTYTGRDERTNAQRPPAVPVTELLDAIERTAGDGAREAVVTRHPLQPFDPRNFRVGALRDDGPWSFDDRMRDGATALDRADRGTGRLLAAPLPPRAETTIALDDLVRFVEHPVKAFLRQRLGVRVSELPDEVADELVLEADGLTKYAVGERLLRARLSGADADAALAAERVRGQLPPAGRLQDRALAEVRPCVQAIWQRAAATLPSGVPVARDVDVALAGDRRVAGTVTGLAGDTLSSVSYATLKAKHRLAAWVRLLALVGSGVPVTQAVTVGKRGNGGAVATIAIPDDVEPGEWARGHLEALVDLRDRGMREPLPLSCEAGAAYVARLARGAGAARAAAEGAWKTDFNRPREDQEPEHLLAFGARLTFDELWMMAGPRDDDEAAWAAEAPSRFAALANRMWEELRRCERT